MSDGEEVDYLEEQAEESSDGGGESSSDDSEEEEDANEGSLVWCAIPTAAHQE